MDQHNDRHTAERLNHWGVKLPYLLPLLTLLALVAIIFASGARMLSTATDLAREDAAIMDWWHRDQRERLNAQAGMIAERLNESTDIRSVVESIGLADYEGYIAWIDGEKSVQSDLNGAQAIGDPAGSKLFAFAPAVGYPAADFWQEGEELYWMSMAPVSAEKGGGVVVIQRAIDEAEIAQLANLVGREVAFYDYENKAPLASSNPDLVTDPPALSNRWMEQVAAGQQPDATRADNSEGEQIVGMVAFPDLAALSYSGYLAVIEPASTVAQKLPTATFWVATLIATLLAAVGALLLLRMLRAYLRDYDNTDYRARRAAKTRMALLALLFCLPMLLAAGYISMQTSNRSAELDLRTAQIAKDVLMPTAHELIADVNRFAADDTAQSLAVTPANDQAPEQALAEALRRAHGTEFALVETSDSITQAGTEELTDSMLEAVTALESGTVDVVQAGKIVMLAAAQAGADGTTTYAGVNLNKRLPYILEFSGVDLTLLNDQTPLTTTLADREIESLYFDEAVEAELAENGTASYQQKVGWNPGNLTIFTLDMAGSDALRMIVSQASVTWANAIRTYQGTALAILALALVGVTAILMSILNLDKPLLLGRIYTGYFFLFPALIWLIWWQLGPALFTAYLSFHKWSVLAPAKPFVGFHNYTQLWNDDVFWNAMKNTFIYVTQIPLGMAIALALALALNRPLRGIKALRTIYYMPAVTSIVVVSLMWKLLYNKDLGIFNYLLSFLGLGPYGFLQSTTMAMPSIMAMAIWLGLGARMILFLAGLQSISDDFYEAADVDGANGWNKFRHITIPLLAPTTFFVFITSIIGSFQVFGPIYVLTQGGPAGATDVAVHRIYFEAWQNLRFGYASAETVILFAFLFIVTAVQFRYFGRNVSYG